MWCEGEVSQGLFLRQRLLFCTEEIRLVLKLFCYYLRCKNGATSCFASLFTNSNRVKGADKMDSYNISLLTGSNWESWKIDMKVLLLHYGAWEFVDVGATTAKPVTIAAKRDTTDDETGTSAEGSLSWREKQELKLRKTRAYTLIYQSLSSELKPLISSTTDGAVAWKTLVDYFEPTTRARVIQLLDSFFSTKLEPGENLGLFLCRVKQAAQRLREVGHNLPHLYQGYQMIRSLPEEFQPTVQVIYRWKDANFVPEKIEAELILEENRLTLSKKDLNKTSVNEIAFTDEAVTKPVYSKSKNVNTKFFNVDFKRQSNTSVKSKSKKIGPCYFCKSYGHLIANCRLKQNNSKQKCSNKNIKETCNVEMKCAFSELDCNLIELSPELCEANTSDLGFESSSWVFDTAATAHFCNNKNLFLTYEPVTNMQMSLAVGEKESPVEGKGIVHFFVKHKDGKYSEIVLKDVLYNPKLRRNLLSGCKLERLGLNFVGSKGKVFVYDKDWNELFYAYRKNELYFVKPTKYKCKRNNSTVAANQVDKCNNNEVWHERFCHVNNDYVTATSKNNSVIGIPKLLKLSENCVSCKLSKSKRISFKSIGKIRSKRALELLHLDLCGPLPVASHGGNRYFLSIIDDFSRKVAVYTLKNKSDVFEIFCRFQKRAERFLDKKIVSVRTDGGLEFCNKEFENFLQGEGIAHEKTNPYSPEMNGVAERFNLTALDGVKAMLNSSGLSQKFWAEALSCFSYVWNRVCHKDTKTPSELYSGRKPSVSHLKKFGCLAYVGVPKQLRKKLDMRSKLGIMCGYAQSTKGYRIWVIDDQKIVETINVRFDESKRGVDQVKKFLGRVRNFSCFDFPDDGNIFPVMEELTTRSGLSGESKTETEKVSPGIDVGTVPSFKQCLAVPWTREAVPRRDGSRTDIYYSIEGTKIRLRSFNDVEKYCDANNIVYDKNLFNFSGKNSSSGRVSDLLNFSTDNEANIVEITIPKTFKQAIRTPESKKWEEAMNKEMQVINDRGVWDLVEPPENTRILGSRWVYTVKTNEKNEIVRYKARLVAQGFNQTKGVNYDEVFSPVVNFSIIRLFFSVFVCFLKWSHIQIDINNAYLYAKLDETVYMYQPEGYVKESSKVCKLRKALYGLHQSSRQWFFEIDDILKINFEKLSWCNCVYVLQSRLILLLYVDDIVMFGKTSDDLEFGKSLLQKHFDLKILGKTKKLLGIEFEEIGEKLFIHQNTYIQSVCKQYERFKFPISSLPIPKGLVLSKQDSPSTPVEVHEMIKFPYRNLIGCLSFIAARTRPDIMYAVNLLSQFQENPGMKHWNSLLKLLGYLKYSQHFKLELSKVKDLNLICYSDSDYAANRDDRVSIGGYILFLDETPISWRTFKQKCISLSTMESEYVTLTEAAKELIWIKNVLENEILNLPLKDNILYCDNQAAIAFSNSPFENHRTKHIHVKYLFLRNLVYEKLFELKYIPTNLNLADSFTKPQVKERLMNFCNKVFEV